MRQASGQVLVERALRGFPSLKSAAEAPLRRAARASEKKHAAALNKLKDQLKAKDVELMALKAKMEARNEEIKSIALLWKTVRDRNPNSMVVKEFEEELTA